MFLIFVSADINDGNFCRCGDNPRISSNIVFRCNRVVRPRVNRYALRGKRKIKHVGIGQYARFVKDRGDDEPRVIADDIVAPGVGTEKIVVIITGIVERDNRIRELKQSKIVNPAAVGIRRRSGIPRNRRIRNGKCAVVANPAAVTRSGIPGNRRIRNGKRAIIVNPAAVIRSGIPRNRRIRNGKRAIILNPAAIKSGIPGNRRIRNGKCAVVANPAAASCGILRNNRVCERQRAVPVINPAAAAIGVRCGIPGNRRIRNGKRGR